MVDKVNLTAAFARSSTLNTGNVVNERTVSELGRP